MFDCVLPVTVPVPDVYCTCVCVPVCTCVLRVLHSYVYQCGLCVTCTLLVGVWVCLFSNFQKKHPPLILFFVLVVLLVNAA